jgi:hypothetical protein
MSRGIPEKAVRALVEHCNRFGDETGRSGAEVFKDYLDWIKRHADYFFAQHWPPKYVPTGTWLMEEECRFITDSRSYEEEVERFTIVLLRRNLSLEGLETECFETEFGFYGRMFCGDCSVLTAMRLREYVAKLEDFKTWIEERKSLEPNDACWMKLYDDSFSAEALRLGKMARVRLGFIEADGAAEGKVCKVHNKYLCPYGALSCELIKLGNMVRHLWGLVKFYDRHWNGSKTCTPSPSETKWNHMGEPGLLDVTSRDDILKALEDGRMDKIVEEFKTYNETFGQN